MQFFAAADDSLFQEHAPELGHRIALAADRGGEAGEDFLEQVRKVQVQAERQGLASRRQLHRQQQWLDKVLTTIAEPTQIKPSHPRQGEAA